MNEIILNYIVQAILGGASGYITNDYAINMLFKEYTPLKIGGVIKKTRTEFIDNLSSMVGNDIISKEKLQSILGDESFKKEFEDLTADFYENCLYEAAGSSIFTDIDGFDSTIDSTDIFVVKMINEHMPDIFKIILDNIDIDAFLNQEQLNNISSSIYSVLTDIFNNTDIFENMCLSVYENNNELILNNILNRDIYKTVISNAVGILTKAVSDINDTEIDEILISSGVKDSLNTLKETLYKRKIKDIINLDGNILKSINDSLLSYVNSEKGTNYIVSLINSLFSYGKECDKSIFQLLDLTFEENLKQYLIKNIPSATESVVNWINENSHLIDYLIGESIDEVINESDGLKAKLLYTIKNTYFKDLSKKYSVADKIISYVKKAAEPEKLSQHISAKLIDILNNLTVREIVGEAEINNITPENAGKFIINYINKNSEQILSKTTDYISNMELKQVIPEELISENLKLNIISRLKVLCNSNGVRDYLTAKLTKYTDSILSEELCLLINNENAKSFATKIKNFIGLKIVSNENSIKKWIEKEIKTAAEYYSKELSPTALTLLNNEFIKKYRQEADALKNLPISTALDKLNSIENLAKNSSESLRTYAANNTDVILSGSIKAIVTDNLNKLDDNELVSLANDFIGRELKPIMYFGGILGIAAGIILAAFQSSTLDPAGINIANMAAYAFVGYITNVIAINMIFKPYKEKKLLSKIPFLRNFSLGYIVKNQKIFAKNTAHFIDNSLLSKKSINEMFDKYKDKIKNSFTDSIAENDYNTLSNLLASNKKSAVKSVFSYLRNEISANMSHICSFLFSKINNIKISSLMNEKMSGKISSFLTDKLQSHDFSKSVHTLMNSESMLEGKISDKLIKNYVSDIQDNYYDKLNNMFSNENEIKKQIFKFENIYQDFINKQINEIIGSEKQDKLAQSAAEKISSIVLSKDSRDKIIQESLGIINKSLDRNKTFGEIFDGNLKDYVDSHMPHVLEYVSEAVKNNIEESKSKITVLVQSEIKNSLGFLEKGMYSLMGGDEIVDELINKIITVKLPIFIDDKKQELNNIAGQLLDEKFYKAEIEVLYTGLNKLQFNELVDNYLNRENSIKVKNKINVFTKNLFSKGGNLRLSSILTLFNMSDLSRFSEVYKNEINAFNNELSLTFSNNKVQIADKLTECSDFLIDELMKSRFKDLFNGISCEDIKCVINKAITKLNKNHIDRVIYSSIKDSSNYLHINAGEFINKEEFTKAAGHCFITLLDNREFEKIVRNHFEAIIDEAVSVNFNFVGDKSKKYILNIFTDSSISSLKRNLDEILRAAEFDIIAKEEIEKMEPEKIHEMFNSFGEKYFRRLMLYGFGGFVFGINIYVGMSLTLLKIISELFTKGNSKQ